MIHVYKKKVYCTYLLYNTVKTKSIILKALWQQKWIASQVYNELGGTQGWSHIVDEIFSLTSSYWVVSQQSTWPWKR